MQPFDADDMMHGMIFARDGLECHQLIEFEYYNNPKMAVSLFNPIMCAYCAGSSIADGVVDAELSIEWKSLLPVCPACRTDSALPLVISRRRNGSSHDSRAQRARLTSQAPQAHVEDYAHVDAAQAPNPSYLILQMSPCLSQGVDVRGFQEIGMHNLSRL